MLADTLEIIDKVLDGRRLSSASAERLLVEADFHELVRAAYRTRMRLHPERTVTYVVDRNINYTNVCVSGCDFCAFYRPPGHAEGYVLDKEVLMGKIGELVAAGGTQVLLQGGLNPALGIEYYEETLRDIRRVFDVNVHGFSPPEVVHIARVSELSLDVVVNRLRDAGLGSLPGGGAEVLSDRVRSEVSPAKCTADEWIEVMRIAHGAGIKTTATMMFGHVETPAERIEHLELVRSLQDETGGFTAFIPWTFQSRNTRIDVEPAGGVEYLRTLALSRLYLDNVPNIQASWVTQGAKIAELALMAGANDLGGTMMEENVVRAAGSNFRMTEDEIRRSIENAGFAPRRRNTFYVLYDS